LTVTGSLTNFTAYTGSFSASQSFALTGSNLSNNVVIITAPANFEISLSQASGYTSSIQLTPQSGAISTTIYVVYSPSTLGTDNGNIVISCTGVNTQNIAVTGTAQAIWLASGNYIYNANSGNVGIGTTGAPTTKLEIVGTTKTTGLQIPTGAGAGKVLTSDANGIGTWQTADFSNGWKLAGNGNTDLSSFIGTTINQPLIFKTNNLERVRINGDGTTFLNGKLSIGDAQYFNSDYALSVKGQILAERVVVLLKSTWPDYTFASDYKLMPLYQVEEYINKNKHLPGVPSEQEVKEKGIELGDMNAVLLEKVEELTLHAIEHKKVIDAQTQLIEDQKILNEKLLKLLEEQNQRIQKLEQK
jgi:hypothetical protein